mmetsp:Transcript_60974/g.178297  ORF Transcript_60974/g.178297 Transcript_60974/m.178297 type:complete len:362 (+) Transcript_60974:1355-2440(+)
MARSCRSSQANWDIRAPTPGACAAPWPLLTATAPRSTMRKLPRPGDVSLDEGLLSLSAVEAVPPTRPGVQGVEHSPSAGLSSSLPSSSLFEWSSMPASPRGCSSALPSSFFCGLFAPLSFPFLRTSLRSRRREPTSPPSPSESVSASFVAVRPKRPRSSSSPSPPRSPRWPWPRNLSAVPRRRRAPCSQKRTFCWWCTRNAWSSDATCRSSMPLVMITWRSLWISSSFSLICPSTHRSCFADWSLMYCSSSRTRSSAAAHLRCACWNSSRLTPAAQAPTAGLVGDSVPPCALSPLAAASSFKPASRNRCCRRKSSCRACRSTSPFSRLTFSSSRKHSLRTSAICRLHSAWPSMYSWACCRM